MVLSVILATLAALSLSLTLWQLLVAARFPLHRRVVAPDFTPSISVLKPLKGCDAETRECLRSWFTQDYAGPVELLFGVASPEDPVCAAVRELLGEYPARQAQLIICDRVLGPNAKVSSLARLEKLARHEIICVSDADVWAPSDFLSGAVAPLRDGQVGLVSCFYRCAGAVNFAMRWEAFAVNADFWSQVLQALSFKPMDFALGAAMLMPRARLALIGGFEPLVDHLADDYQLGNRIARSGARVMVTPVVVECRNAPMGFGEVWAHQLRWARTIRACRPWPYFWSVLANAALWPLLWAAIIPGWSSLAGAALCLAIRWAGGAYLESRMTGRRGIFTGSMALVKDLLQVTVWAMSFAGRKVSWRGVDYHIKHGGKLVKFSNAEAANPSAT